MTLYRVTAQSLEVLSSGSGTAGGYGAHLYWRLNVTANDGDASLLQIAEIEFRASAGGADQATGGTASGSTQYYLAADAFDNNAGTYWSTDPGNPGGWIRYQFPASVSVVQIAVTSNPYVPARSPKDFDVQYSDDGSTWTTAWSVTGQTGWTAGQTRTFTGSTGTASTVPVRVTGQSIEALVPTYEMRIAKAAAYAVLGTGPGISVSKAAAYAVLHDTSIGAVPDVPVTRRRPVLAFVG